MALTCACTDSDNPSYEVRKGDTIPAFSVELTDGSVFVSSGDFGKTALIAFFHTGCPDCRKELPALQQLYDSIGQDIRLILISRQEPADEIEDYWRANGLTMPYSPQEDRSIFSMFASSGIPRGYIVGRDHIVRYDFSDKNMPDYTELRKQIENANE
ncbi:MAG: TlpA family protein disulfide reductase [Bacteroidaceae bacterium]|nr:TlpA family protein disulfide reductase [Bacteroidaceae bacterium]